MDTIGQKILVNDFNTNKQDSPVDPYSFKAYVRKRGLLAEKNSKNISSLVVMDCQPRVFFGRLRRRVENNHLVRMEPAVVLPSNYKSSLNKKYNSVVTVGGNPRYFDLTVPWPQVWPTGILHMHSDYMNRAESPILINSNKISLIPGELYTLRRAALLTLSNVTLYGFGWASSLSERLLTLIKSLLHAVFAGQLPRMVSISYWFSAFPNWRGALGDDISLTNAHLKIKVMSGHKYALVIENSAEYMSEKLFDAFFAGCIPIYVGPNVEDYGIPKNIVVQAEPNLKSIEQALETAKEMNFENFQQDLRKFLSDEKTIEKWSHENVYARMLEIILGKPLESEELKT